jgi:hypothetical protein
MSKEDKAQYYIRIARGQSSQSMGGDIKSGTIKWERIMVIRRVKGKDMQPDFNMLVCPHDSNCGTVHNGCSSNAGTACMNI